MLSYIPCRYRGRLAPMALTETRLADLSMPSQHILQEALAASETASVTVDLTTPERIASFAAIVEQVFDPQLLCILGSWVAADDKEQARDAITLDGKTASAVMWRNGFSFIDVLCSVQRDMNQPSPLRRQYHKILISQFGPEYIGVPPVATPRSKLNIIGSIMSIWHGRHTSTLNTPDSLAQLGSPPEDATALMSVNREMLQAEQLVKNRGYELDEMVQVCEILGDRKAEVAELLEQDASLIAEYGTTEEMPPVQRLDDNWLATTVKITDLDISLHKIQFERVTELLSLLEQEQARRAMVLEQGRGQLVRVRARLGTVSEADMPLTTGDARVDTLLKILDMDSYQKPHSLVPEKISPLLEARSALDEMLRKRRSIDAMLDCPDAELSRMQAEYNHLWDIYGEEIDREINEKLVYRVLSQQALRADISKKTTYNRIKEGIILEQRRQQESTHALERDDAHLCRNVAGKGYELDR